MSIGKDASATIYIIGGTPLLVTITVKDLGKLVQSNMNTSKQYG